MIDPGLQDKVALVTGANAGIGAAIAKELARQGTSTVIHFLEPSRKNDLDDYSIEHMMEGASAADEVQSYIRDQGGRAMTLSGDLSEPESIPNLFSTVERKFGPVSVLVNNAAHCELPDTILKASSGNIDRHFSVNTRAPVLLISEFAKRYQEHALSSGSMINISTDSAQTFPSQISYGASKAALEAYTRSIAVEVGPLGITVNAIAPGPIQTGWIDQDLEEQLLPSIAMRRVGRPEDVADTVIFLASYQARWITGQVIRVAGGHVI